MTATGTLEKALWPYWIKLRQGTYDPNQKSDCGDFGTSQIEAATNAAGHLNVTFPLNTAVQALPIGPVDAFFCALPSPNKYTTAVLNTDPLAPTTGVSSMYIDTWGSQITVI